MLDTNDAFSLEENDAIIRLQAIAAAFDKSKNTKKMTTASPLAQGKKLIATKGQNMTTGYYSTKVPIGLLDLHNFIFPSTREETGNYIDRSVEEINDHHSIRYLAKAFLKPVSDREWHRSVITKVEAEKVVIVSVPCLIEEKVKERPLRTDRVRAETRAMTILTKISDNETRLDNYAEFGFGGYIPRWVINRELPKIMSAPTKSQEHFQHQRKLNQLNVEDGKNMGIMLMIKKKGGRVEKRLEAFFSKNEALQQLKTTSFPQLEGMMLAILKNILFHKKARQQQKRRDGNKVAVSGRSDNILNNLTEAEATKIGRSFALLLLTTTEPSAAVDAWKLDNQVLVPLFAEHAWFEPMINTIAKQLLQRSSLGLKWRVGLGAFLSIG